jgi:hypothetical protein
MERRTMKGRIPKDPDSRRRRNKASTAATLDPNEAANRKAPPLPRSLFPTELHKLTRRWWGVIWRSPMASRWLPSDVEGLYLVAILRNEFFWRPTANLAAEIRQQETRFGLDVLARRRLDWRIGGALLHEATPPEKELEPVRFDDAFDPRAVLRAVK